ncbi:MAG: hypothetical protein KBT30_00430 [Clostridiales bacterium]|nr:hypothetical protein [Candidatus Apopatousia equi]
MERKIIDTVKMNNCVIKNAIEYIDLCESEYKSQMEKIVEYIKLNNEIKFILLAGPSSSGKTTTAKLLKQNLEANGYNAKTISLDDFFVERSETPLWDDGRPNYETVDSIDWKLFDDCVHNLLTDGKSLMPTYNFITGEKEFHETLTLNNKDIIIIEGLHALNKIIDNFINTNLSLKIYLAPSVEYIKNDETLLDGLTVRFFRRLIRDLYTRGSNPDKTLEEWKDVIEGEKLYIDPFKNTAQFTINTAHPYEVCVYKDILKFLNLDTHEVLKDKVKIFENFSSISKDNVPQDSLLQEFVH